MNTDQKFGLILLILCLVIWFLIPTQVGEVRAAIYPRFITLWIAMSSVFLIILSRKNASKRIWYGPKEITRVIVIAVTVLIYILIIDFLGFYISSLSFLVIIMIGLGLRDWRILVLIPPMFMLFIYLLIEKLLVFPLPKGRIF